MTVNSHIRRLDTAQLSDKVLVLCVFSHLSEIRRLTRLSYKVFVSSVVNLVLNVFTVDLI